MGVAATLPELSEWTLTLEILDQNAQFRCVWNAEMCSYLTIIENGISLSKTKVTQINDTKSSEKFIYFALSSVFIRICQRFGARFRPSFGY